MYHPMENPEIKELVEYSIRCEDDGFSSAQYSGGAY